MKQFRNYTLAFVALAAFGGSWGAYRMQMAFAEKAAAPVVLAPVTDNLKDLFVELSKRLVPSVVNIYTTQVVQSSFGNNQQNEMYRRFFENFFGEDALPNVPQSRKATSLGTGFIIDDKENLVLTNYHVIADAEEIKVILTEQESDQDGIDAKVVGGDAEADVALLKIKTKRKLQAVNLGDSDHLDVGEWVMAVGNPFGHGHTVTKGIISAKERIIPISQFANYLQTDTPINPGNSGGPLINTAGQVIGINTAINAAAQGIGFAIPINFVKRILPDLRSKGTVTRGFIGINITELTPPMAKSLRLKENFHGVVVSDVTEGEPAQKAGIQAYDIITEVNGKTITDGRQLVASISSVAPGEKVKLKILRGGKEKEFNVEVAKRPTRDSMLSGKSKNGSHQGPNLKLQAASGLTVEELDADAKHELNLPASTQGVLVSKVVQGSPAEDAGMRRGDVVVEVDQRPTPTVDAFYRVVREEKVYLVRLRRGDGFAITSYDLSPPSLHKQKDE